VSPRTSRAADPAVAGLLTTGLALGVAELVAGFRKGAESPIVAVGGEVIDAVPAPVKDFAIATFGTNDKVALIVGILVLLAVFGAVVGIIAVRRLSAGIAAIAVFGVVGAAAALSRPGADGLDATPSIVGAAAGAVALTALVAALAGRSATSRSAATAAQPPPPATPTPPRATRPPPSGDPVTAGTRRRFLTTGLAVAAIAAGAGSIGRVLTRGFSAAGSRAAVVLPAAASPLPALPAGTDLGIQGLSPFTTPNIAFYRIDTALVVPQVQAEDWSLRIHGMVDRS
jgi:hypothetical protein